MKNFGFGSLGFDDLTNNNAAGAAVGGILGSLFGDTTEQKVGGAIIGSVLGDIISDELEEKSQPVVIERRVEKPIYVESAKSSGLLSNYDDILRYIDSETRNILSMPIDASKKHKAMDELRNSISSYFYGDKITYEECQQLKHFVEVRMNLI